MPRRAARARKNPWQTSKRSACCEADELIPMSATLDSINYILIDTREIVSLLLSHSVYQLGKIKHPYSSFCLLLVGLLVGGGAHLIFNGHNNILK